MTSCDRSRSLSATADANQVFFAGTDHPMAKSATADSNASAREGLRQAIERCAVDIFMNKSKGQRRGRGNTARQGLRGHRRDDNGSADVGAFAVAAGILGPGILQHRGFHLDMQLLGDEFAHAMQRMAAARTGLLIVGKVIFNAFAWRNSAGRGLRPRLLAFRRFHVSGNPVFGGAQWRRSRHVGQPSSVLGLEQRCSRLH